MCGISGLANCGDRETLARMTSIQSHRGPDDSGLWDRRSPDGSYIGLGSRRLAIIDLSSAGHMPMCNEGRSIWITYNGEIYNHHDLRQELESKGHIFASNTDTEVILHLYEHNDALVDATAGLASGHRHAVVATPGRPCWPPRQADDDHRQAARRGRARNVVSRPSRRVPQWRPHRRAALGLPGGHVSFR